MSTFDVFASFAQQALAVHPLVLAAFFVLFVYMVLRLFNLMAKSAIVGVIAAAFPVFLHYIGYSMDISLANLAFFGAIGFVGHMAFASLMSLFRTGRNIFRLGRKITGSGSKPKVTVKKIFVKEKKK